MTKRYTLDDLCKAIGVSVNEANAKPIAKIGAGVAKAKLNRYAAFPEFCLRMVLPKPVTEFKFHPDRRWRMDHAWPEHRVYLEIQGGIFTNGRHSRGAAMIKEWEKVNTASAMGWRILYCQPSALMTGAMAETIRTALNYQRT